MVETYFERITSSGQIELRTISDNLSSDAEKNYPIYAEWSLKNLQTVKNAGGKDFLQFDSFRYSARVPINLTNVVSYETTGFTLGRFNLPENVPTIAGSFSMPKSGEFVFVIVTVKKAGE